MAAMEADFPGRLGGPLGATWQGRLGVALAISLAAHLLVAVGMRAGPGVSAVPGSSHRSLSVQLVAPPAAASRDADPTAMTAIDSAPSSLPTGERQAEDRPIAATPPASRISASGQVPLDLLQARQYYLASRVHRPPAILKRAEFAYPESIRVREGVIVARVLINEEGKVDGVVVEVSTPAGVFDSAAIETLLQWRFAPGLLHGRPVPTQIAMEVRFSASDEIPPAFSVLGRDR
jgi:TonB family protein